MVREYQLIGETGFETPWQPIPEKGLVAVKPNKELKEKLGETYGVSIRTVVTRESAPKP